MGRGRGAPEAKGKLEPGSSVDWKKKGASEQEAGGDREGPRGASGVAAGGDEQAAERRPFPRALGRAQSRRGSLHAVVASSASVFIMVPRVARGGDTTSLNLAVLLQRQGFGTTPEGLAGGRRAPAPPSPRGSPGGVVFPSPLPGLARPTCLQPPSPRWCGESGAIEAGAPAGRCRPCSLGAPSDRQLNR